MILELIKDNIIYLTVYVTKLLYVNILITLLVLYYSFILHSLNHYSIRLFIQIILIHSKINTKFKIKDTLHKII
jgi:hypothetical protein